MIQGAWLPWLVVHFTPGDILQLGLVLTVLGLVWATVSYSEESYGIRRPAISLPPAILLTAGVWFLGILIGYATAVTLL